MKWRAESKSLDFRRYEIKYDPVAGFYFYVFEQNKCVYDDLQDTLEIAMECALEDYGVPITAWKKIE